MNPTPSTIYNSIQLKSNFDELTREMGLTDIAADLGATPMSHTEAILATLLTMDESMLRIKDRVRKMASASIPILILGATGTGKELIAQALHGDRKPASFVAVNCGAIPSELLESELFGHRKGAFTSANADKKGLIEQARDGTLFLDEIGDMPKLLQCKLLRVLETKKYRQVGALVETPIQFRLVSATNHIDLAVKEDFREDLYYRLAGHVITLPPLKQRNHNDISLIAAHMAPPGIAEMAVIKAQDSNLRGNVRELINIIEELKALYA